MNLESRWCGYFEQQYGNVCDLSIGGCFILTSGEVMPMELIEIEIELTTDRWLRLWGQVAYFVTDIGFGVCFTGVDEETHDSIVRFIDGALEHGALLAAQDEIRVGEAYP